MSVQHDSMIHPNFESLLGVESVEGSKFQLVTLASYRARQINSYFTNLGQGTDKAIPPQVSTTARKPLSIAFEEIAADKVSAKPVELALPEESLDLPTGEETIADADAE